MSRIRSLAVISLSIHKVLATPTCSPPAYSSGWAWNACSNYPETYLSVPFNTENHYNANLECESKNSTLVSVWNADIDICLQETLELGNNPDSWIGAIFNTTDEIWRWADGIHFMGVVSDYNHCDDWNNGICANSSGNYLATTNENNNYHWNSVQPCSNILSYVCEYKCPETLCPGKSNCQECEYLVEPDLENKLVVECTTCNYGYYYFGVTTDCFRKCNQDTYQPWTVTCENSDAPSDIECKFETVIKGVETCLYFSETYNLMIPSDYQQFINFDKRQIKRVTKNSFDGIAYDYVSRIYLDDNSIEDLPLGIFDDFRFVEELWLDFNYIKSLPSGIFSDMTKLKMLRIPGNELTSLPADIFQGLEDLEILYIYSNHISSLPVGIFDGLVNIEWLFANYNEITEIPEGMFDGSNFAKLEHLALEHNNLTSVVEGTFEGLVNIQSLGLQSNFCEYSPSQCNGRTWRKDEDRQALQTCQCV